MYEGATCQIPWENRARVAGSSRVRRGLLMLLPTVGLVTVDQSQVAGVGGYLWPPDTPFKASSRQVDRDWSIIGALGTDKG